MYPHFAVVALGSNLANPAEQVRAALAELDAHPHIRLEKASSLYLTAPVGYDDQRLYRENFIGRRGAVGRVKSHRGRIWARA